MKKDKSGYKKKKIRFSKKRILITFGYTYLSLIFFYISDKLTAPEYKYPRQFVIFFGFAALTLALISFGKLFTKDIKHELYQRLSSVMMNILGRVKKVTDKIKSALGMESVSRLRSNDEVRIIINEDIRARGKKKRLAKKRFSQLEDDLERIRFMYVKLLGLKQKQGKSVHLYQSPCELKKKISDNEAEDELFELYTPVRYAESPYVSPEEVKKQYDYLMAATGKKNMK